MDLAGKVAIITGAKRGIGKAITLKLAQEGLNLALCSLNSEGSEELVSEVKTLNNNTKVLYRSVDLKNAAEVKAFIADVNKQFGKIDIIVNNAGVVRVGPVIKTEESDWDLVMDTNLKAPFLVIKEVLPFMKTNGNGHIVNITSLAGKEALPCLGAYCASKFGLIGFSLALKEELRRDNIQLSLVQPGAVTTDIWNDIPGEFDHSKMATPEDIANSVLFVLKNADSCTIDEIVVMPKSGTL